MRTYEDIAQDIQLAYADLAFARAHGDWLAVERLTAYVGKLDEERERTHAARG